MPFYKKWEFWVVLALSTQSLFALTALWALSWVGGVRNELVAAQHRLTMQEAVIARNNASFAREQMKMNARMEDALFQPAAGVEYDPKSGALYVYNLGGTAFTLWGTNVNQWGDVMHKVQTITPGTRAFYTVLSIGDREREELRASGRSSLQVELLLKDAREVKWGSTHLVYLSRSGSAAISSELAATVRSEW